ncbi:uncharacterized protein FIBRA_05114 [Fibroporia radiculosa]|uniref:DUF7330 domain-containing protein n=1 Tax=Fibroporia radiculosa TaxID=599839 RepID=J4H3B8_9APHY|nr:uncharacterized protein FIBRA_05114 [Fibroporia radiculosa]CCM02999.1 predicted protein [Fibroporia radiculosa]
MIIADDTPSSPAKAQQPLSAQRGSEGMPPPPAYSGPSTNFARDPQGYFPRPSEALLPPVSSSTDEIEPAGRRFFKAFGVAFLIYLLLGLFTRSTIEVAYWGRGRLARIDLSFQINHDEFGWPLHTDGKVVRCVKGISDWNRVQFEESSTASFELPLSADVLYLFARGSLSSGSVTYVQDTDWENNGTVRVDVAAKYGTRAVLDRVSVCQLERQEGHSGIGILSPLNWHTSPFERFVFDVTVYFPISPHISPLRIEAFETKLPSFSQRVGDLHGEVVFGTLSLQSSNSHISAESVYADRAMIRSSNSAIKGTFHASESLSLVTSNAQIIANITLGHNGANSASTQLTMRTSNGAIESDVNLISTSPSYTGGSFNVSARTSNSHLTLDFPQSALDAHLDVDAKTSNGLATVSLNRAFEGPFVLQTSSARPIVQFNQHVEDPTDLHRKRALSYSENTGFVKGEVTWSRPGYRNGGVNVRTSNAPIVFNLL